MHVSAMADRFVKDPHDVVAAGEVVKVRVVEVDVARKRIGLSMRSGDRGAARPVREKPESANSKGKPSPTRKQPFGSLGDALIRARKGKA